MLLPRATTCLVGGTGGVSPNPCRKKGANDARSDSAERAYFFRKRQRECKHSLCLLQKKFCFSPFTEKKPERSQRVFFHPDMGKVLG